jgi:hypothetical protein
MPPFASPIIIGMPPLLHVHEAMCRYTKTANPKLGFSDF